MSPAFLKTGDIFVFNVLENVYDSVNVCVKKMRKTKGINLMRCLFLMLLSEMKNNDLMEIVFFLFYSPIKEMIQIAKKQMIPLEL